VLQCVAVCFGEHVRCCDGQYGNVSHVLHCVALLHCVLVSTRAAVTGSMGMYVMYFCSVLQCGAVWCSVEQCVAVWRSMV